MQDPSWCVFFGDEVGLTQAGEALMPGEVKEYDVFFAGEEETQQAEDQDQDVLLLAALLQDVQQSALNDASTGANHV